MITGILHGGVMCNNFDKSLQFYTEVLGGRLMQRAERPDGARLAFISMGNNEIVELIWRPGLKPKPFGAGEPGYVGLNHLGLLVDDLDKTCDELQAKGIRFLEGPTPPRPGERRIAYFTDPDGNRIHLTALPK